MHANCERLQPWSLFLILAPAEGITSFWRDQGFPVGRTDPRANRDSISENCASDIGDGLVRCAFFPQNRICERLLIRWNICVDMSSLETS